MLERELSHHGRRLLVLSLAPARAGLASLPSHLVARVATALPAIALGALAATSRRMAEGAAARVVWAPWLRLVCVDEPDTAMGDEGFSREFARQLRALADAGAVEAVAALDGAQRFRRFVPTAARRRLVEAAALARRVAAPGTLFACARCGDEARAGASRKEARRARTALARGGCRRHAGALVTAENGRNGMRVVVWDCCRRVVLKEEDEAIYAQHRLLDVVSTLQLAGDAVGTQQHRHRGWQIRHADNDPCGPVSREHDFRLCHDRGRGGAPTGVAATTLRTLPARELESRDVGYRTHWVLSDDGRYLIEEAAEQEGGAF